MVILTYWEPSREVSELLVPVVEGTPNKRPVACIVVLPPSLNLKPSSAHAELG